MTIRKQDFLRIVGKVGPLQEFDSYRGLYERTPVERLAVVKISGQCIDESLEKIAEDLADLHKLGFVPTVTHGWGKALSSRLESAGIPTKKISDDRYTDSKVMEHVVEIAKEYIEKLNAAIEKRGGKARILWPQETPIIIAEDKKEKRYGEYNGEIVRVNIEPIIETLKNGEIALISPLGISEDGKKLYNLNSASSSSRIVAALDPLKYLFFTGTKGILRTDKTVISEIVLNRDLETLKRTGILTGGALKNVEEATFSLNSRTDGEDKSVQFTGPENIMLELYSQKGTGTYIRTGYQIEAEPVDLWDKERIIRLIEKSFSEKLKPGFFKECVKDAHVERRYKGAAIVIPEENDPELKGISDYLDMIAIDYEYVEKDMGKDLLESVFDYQPAGDRRLFWRSKIQRNSGQSHANKWYFQISDGHQKYTGIDGMEFNAFWIGLNQEQVSRALGFLENRAFNFE